MLSDYNTRSTGTQVAFYTSTRSIAWTDTAGNHPTCATSEPSKLRNIAKPLYEYFWQVSVPVSEPMVLEAIPQEHRGTYEILEEFHRSASARRLLRITITCIRGRAGSSATTRRRSSKPTIGIVAHHTEYIVRGSWAFRSVRPGPGHCSGTAHGAKYLISTLFAHYYM